MKSIQSYRLPISRAAFVNGRSPFRYLEAFNTALFLSANEKDVREAIKRGAPAGQVLPTTFRDDVADSELRIAFDFDGIIADDSAEAVFKSADLAEFHDREARAAAEPMPPGPLAKFVREVARLQRRERDRMKKEPGYEPRLRLAIITARNAPAHERVVTTLRKWGIEIDEVFFLGGIDKARIIKEFRPHIVFDDRRDHLEAASQLFPCVHVPFGIANEPPSPELIQQAYEENEHRQKNKTA